MILPDVTEITGSICKLIICRGRSADPRILNSLGSKILRDRGTKSVCRYMVSETLISPVNTILPNLLANVGASLFEGGL